MSRATSDYDLQRNATVALRLLKTERDHSPGNRTLSAARCAQRHPVFRAA